MRNNRTSLKLKGIPPRTVLAVLVLTICVAASAAAQVDRSSELYKTLKAKDARLFGEGFNKCNIGVFREIVSDDVEFFHDVNGSQNSKEEFIKGIEIGLCREGTPPVKRTLDEDSLEVFPLRSDGKLYGAIQMGVHYFGETGQARFTHLWLLRDGEWKLARVISYDHREKEKAK
jgi:hypothetical protein